MKSVAIVCCECVPFVKVGGLADVTGALLIKLPKYIDTKIFLPAFSQVTQKYPCEIIGECEVYFSKDRVEKALFLRMKEKNNVYLIANSRYFDRPELYGEHGTDYPDNLLRFSFFSKAVLECCKKFGISVDVFHCNDWHTALLPLYKKLFYPDTGAASVFTIHNLAYQGIFPSSQFPSLGLGNEFFSMEQLEFYGNINLMKAGIIHSDLINTVSPTYAKEILTAEFGCKLEGLLKTREKDLVGILNGIDYLVWNPMFDTSIFKKYRTRKGKLVNKTMLQNKFSLPTSTEIPLFGFVGRFVQQKGIDLIVEAVENLKEKDFQLIALGTGEVLYENAITLLAKKYPDRVAVKIGFDDALARQIYAGCDYFLMPSRFEPCGLGQMIALKYGTIPIVRKTGGLADTVQPINKENREGWGFVFEKADFSELVQVMTMAIETYPDSSFMEHLFKMAISLDFSWNKSVEQYLTLYQKALEKQ
ncbi:MAG TPA: glycogen synthase GlgA [bacterium]|nr:glycogen synthase GlgA [bacterium]HOL34830.1 glycogen synthase GlgA [bacterium]HPP07907.1 glycogen synthase GlgA [bacterium]